MSPKNMSKLQTALFFLITICTLIAPTLSAARTVVRLSSGQLLYVPVYSHIYGGDHKRGNEILLTVTLSLRNTDPTHRVTLTQIDYYDSKGKLIKKYLKKPIQLQPFASTRYIIKESEKEGGSGANFLVGWQTEDGQKIHAPLVETVMISTKAQLGISFTSRAIVLEEGK